MKVFIIGTGNVATTLGTAILKAGHSISGVLGRTGKNIATLSEKLKCGGFSEPSDIPLNADVYLIAVKDDALEEVIRKLPALKGTVAHTSGATPIDVLKRFRKRGVFYPVETITQSQKVILNKVPICIEASDKATEQVLMQLADSLSSEIYLLNSQQRAVLHLAAVFTNNFTNALLSISEELLKKEHLPVNLLKQLALSTISHAFLNGTLNSQTGPAKRNDVKTMEKHLALLKDFPEYVSIYKLLSRHIRNVQKKK